MRVEVDPARALRFVALALLLEHVQLHAQVGVAGGFMSEWTISLFYIWMRFEERKKGRRGGLWGGVCVLRMCEMEGGGER